MEVFDYKLEKMMTRYERTSVLFSKTLYIRWKVNGKENLLTRASYYSIGKDEILQRLNPLMQAFRAVSGIKV